jgi:hypothetical protein
MPGSSRLRFWVLVALQAATALVIGMLIAGYAQVSTCMAQVQDETARINQARAVAAAQDREVNMLMERLDASDRERLRADQTAMLKLMQTLPARDRAAAMRRWKATLGSYATTNRVMARNAAERDRVGQARKLIEAQRARNPLPAGPSARC